ncbi:MAG: GatB/YqeY domain-containing protein [Nitrospirota bacterium]
MTLKERLNADMKEALKAHDAARLSTIRMVISAVRNKEIDSRKDMDDEGVLSVLSTSAKQRRESIEQYEKAGRQDLVDKEKAELEVIISYMPQQMGREEIQTLVKDAVAESGAKGPGDMGKVMKVLMPKVKGRADGKLVNEVVKEALGG